MIVFAVYATHYRWNSCKPKCAVNSDDGKSLVLMGNPCARGIWPVPELISVSFFYSVSCSCKS